MSEVLVEKIDPVEVESRPDWMTLEVQLPPEAVRHVARCFGEFGAPDPTKVAQYLGRVLDDHFRSVANATRQGMTGRERERLVLRGVNETWFNGPIPMQGCTDRELYRVLAGVIEFATMRRIRDKARREGYVVADGLRSGAQVWKVTKAGRARLDDLDVQTKVL